MRTRTLLRAVTLVLLAFIGGDLGDAACDAPDASGTQAVQISAGTRDGAAAEACASVCVPDCFCCAGSVVALRPIAPARLAGLAELALVPTHRWTDGVRPVLDHPPALLS